MVNAPFLSLNLHPLLAHPFIAFFPSLAKATAPDETKTKTETGDIVAAAAAAMALEGAAGAGAGAANARIAAIPTATATPATATPATAATTRAARGGERRGEATTAARTAGMMSAGDLRRRWEEFRGGFFRLARSCLCSAAQRVCCGRRDQGRDERFFFSFCFRVSG